MWQFRRLNLILIGGPLIIDGGDEGDDVQVGVVSFGTGCADADYPGVYARVSAPLVLHWIQYQIERCVPSTITPRLMSLPKTLPISLPKSLPNHQLAQSRLRRRMARGERERRMITLFHARMTNKTRRSCLIKPASDGFGVDTVVFSNDVY